MCVWLLGFGFVFFLGFCVFTHYCMTWPPPPIHTLKKLWLVWIFNLLKQFLCVWNKLSLWTVSPHLQHFHPCNTNDITSDSIKLKWIKSRGARLICQHNFIFMGGKWNDNISWMVLNLHYKRAIMCFHQVVRFLQRGFWIKQVSLIKKINN